MAFRTKFTIFDYTQDNILYGKYNLENNFVLLKPLSLTVEKLCLEGRLLL